MYKYALWGAGCCKEDAYRSPFRQHYVVGGHAQPDRLDSANPAVSPALQATCAAME